MDNHGKEEVGGYADSGLSASPPNEPVCVCVCKRKKHTHTRLSDTLSVVCVVY